MRNENACADETQRRGAGDRSLELTVHFRMPLKPMLPFVERHVAISLPPGISRMGYETSRSHSTCGSCGVKIPEFRHRDKLLVFMNQECTKSPSSDSIEPLL